MSKMIAFAVLVALATTPALAENAGWVEPSAPQPIAAVRLAGKGTVAGTIVAVGRRGFLLDDGTERLLVRDKHLGAVLQPETRATVVGRMKGDHLHAQLVVRDDGSSATHRDRSGPGR